MNSADRRQWLTGLLLVAGVLVSSAHAATPGLRLRVGTVTPSETLSDMKVALPQVRQVIQFRGVLSADQRAALADLGIRLGAYLPPNGYVAEIGDVDPQTVQGLPFVAAVGPYRPAWRLDPDLAVLTPDRSGGARLYRRIAARAALSERLPADRAALLAQDRVRVTVASFSGEDPAEVRASLAAVPGVTPGGMVTAGGTVLIDAVAELGALEAVTQLPGVQFVEHAPVGSLRNATTGPVVQSGFPDLTPVWAAGLHGEGEIIGLIDAPPRLSHCMFSDVVDVGPLHRKFAASRPMPPLLSHSHGTFVAGVLAGDLGLPGVYDENDGVAFGARISFSDYFDVDDAPTSLLDRFVDAHNDGARIHTNSWGDNSSTAYTVWCNIIDQFSYDHEDDLVIFAATNLASLRSPENAKNVLAVGATSQYPAHNYHCEGGVGPTDDGRRKPEIFAPGCGVYSANYATACGLTSGFGTSYAAPAIAGAAALARQYFVEGFYPDGYADAAHTLTPTGALLRATLLNATEDMTGVTGYPSNTEGWGRLVLDNALHFIGDARRLDVRDVRNADGLNQGETDSWHVSVYDSSEPLRVTMVFTDPPAAIGTADPVINNLDLTVTAPGGAIYAGNAFAGGVSVPGGAADPQNTVEQVLLAAPARGAYTVSVSATTINGVLAQGYAVAVSGAIVSGAYSLPAGFGDVDVDGDRDLADFAAFQCCFTGDGLGYASPGCGVFDADADGDIDEADFGPLRQILASPMP